MLFQEGFLSLPLPMTHPHPPLPKPASSCYFSLLFHLPLSLCSSPRLHFVSTSPESLTAPGDSHCGAKLSPQPWTPHSLAPAALQCVCILPALQPYLNLIPAHGGPGHTVTIPNSTWYPEVQSMYSVFFRPSGFMFDFFLCPTSHLCPCS